MTGGLKYAKKKKVAGPAWFPQIGNIFFRKNAKSIHQTRNAENARAESIAYFVFFSREVRYVNPFRFYTISLVDATRPDVNGQARF